MKDRVFSGPDVEEALAVAAANLGLPRAGLRYVVLDPAQQRIMMLMPLMLAGMFLWAPAGLNLYWLTSNVWSVAQQFVEMRLLKPAEAKTRGERRAK